MPFKTTNSTLKKVFRAVLRAVPTIPGPEIYDLLLEVKRSQQGVDAQVREAIEATVGRQAGKERWIAFGINIAAGIILFVLGIWLSDPLKHLWSTLLL